MLDAEVEGGLKGPKYPVDSIMTTPPWIPARIAAAARGLKVPGDLAGGLHVSDAGGYLGLPLACSQ